MTKVVASKEGVVDSFLHIFSCDLICRSDFG